MDFSQHGEQPVILDFFERHEGAPRWCVDAGAFDGVTGSNSRALFLAGWAGVAIEPDPRTFAVLSALYADRPDVRCVRRALSDSARLARMNFTLGPPGTPPEVQWHYAQVNTFSRSFARQYEVEHDYIYKRAWVRVSRLAGVLSSARAPRDIGFMTIDCEGEDQKIIASMDWGRWRPWLLCVESDENSRPAFAALLEPHGFRYHAHTVANTFFARAG